MSNQLTAEQLKKIEENRQRALERRAQRLGQTTSTKTSGVFGASSAQTQPSKQSSSSDPAASSHPKDTRPQGSTSQHTRFVPPFKNDSQGLQNKKQAPNYQQAPGPGNQINQSILCNSTSIKQVGLLLIIFLYV